MMFWGLIHRSKSPENARIEFKIRLGWGERIRTSDWLIQNQLPYHLATPQRRPSSVPDAPRHPLFAASAGGIYWAVMDLLELLRFQARRYRCSACGENMADCGINVLAQQGNRALVRVTCASCNDENLLQIIFQTEAEVKNTPAIDEGTPDVADPITGDEMLELHSLLSSHEGALTDLLVKR